jgi:hypothetical protein
VWRYAILEKHAHCNTVTLSVSLKKYIYKHTTKVLNFIKTFDDMFRRVVNVVSRNRYLYCAEVVCVKHNSVGPISLGSRVLLEKLIVSQLVKTCLSFYRTRNYITVYPRARHFVHILNQMAVQLNIMHSPMLKCCQAQSCCRFCCHVLILFVTTGNSNCQCTWHSLKCKVKIVIMKQILKTSGD